MMNDDEFISHNEMIFAGDWREGSEGVGSTDIIIKLTTGHAQWECSWIEGAFQ